MFQKKSTEKIVIKISVNVDKLVTYFLTCENVYNTKKWRKYSIFSKKLSTFFVYYESTF